VRIGHTSGKSLRDVRAGAAYAPPARMKAANPYDLHDHAGARWLAPFLAIFALTVAMAFLMLAYPHLF
jgi:hypothetical protein